MDGHGRPPEDINPYAAPAVPLDAPDASATAFDLTRDEVRDYVGKKNTYYWGVWQLADPRKGLKTRFNWAAFFLNSTWLLYRKMYLEFFMLTGVTFGVDIALRFVRHLGEFPKAGLNGANSVINFGLSVALGVIGNGLYLRRARRIIAGVRAESADPAQRMHLLTRRGGTSILRALVGVAGVIVVARLIQLIRL